MVRAFASHQYGPGSIPGLGVIFGFRLVLVLVLDSKGFFFSGYSGSPLSSKKKHHLQIPIRSNSIFAAGHWFFSFAVMCIPSS